MAEQTLHGSCLCKSVRYEVSTPFARFGHCYCSRCRKATGGVDCTKGGLILNSAPHPIPAPGQ